MTRYTLGTLLCLLPAIANAADFDQMKKSNWHHWRGPLASGFAPAATPPITWSEEKNIRWKVPLPGQGISTPIVWQGRIYLTAAAKMDKVDPKLPKAEDQPRRPFGIKFANHFHQFMVLCLDLKTGQKIWSQTVAQRVPFQGHHPDNALASSSPVTDGKRLYVWFGSQGFYCFDLDGKPLWKRDFGPARTRLSFGEAVSPVVHKDRVFVIRDTEDQSYLLALNAQDGKTLWKKERDEHSAWATPLIVSGGGKTQLVTNASNRVRSYDVTTGDVIWECGGQVMNVTPSPVTRDGLVFCASGYRGAALFALPLDQTGDLTDSKKIRWQHDRGTPYVPSLLLYENTLYFNKSNNPIVSSIDAKSGKLVIEESRLKSIRRIYASPVAANGYVYFVGREGVTNVLKHGAKLDIVAVNKLESRIDASPAIVGDQILLRGHRNLYCIAKD